VRYSYILLWLQEISVDVPFFLRFRNDGVGVNMVYHKHVLVAKGGDDGEISG